jgi:hypothetical protein
MSFQLPVGHLNTLLEELPIQVLCPVLIGSFYFILFFAIEL